MALEGTIVFMPVPVKPPQIPTASRVGRSHLQMVQRVVGTRVTVKNCHAPLLFAAIKIKRSQGRAEEVLPLLTSTSLLLRGS